MISFDQAIARINASIHSLGSEAVPLNRAASRVLADPLRAQLDSPRQAVSAMDGYAVRDADVSSPGARLRLIGESFAGSPFSGVLGPADTVRIFTGAALPAGADRVIMQENVSRAGSTVEAHPLGNAWHVRQQASDFAAGTLLLDAGTLLAARAMVVAAAADEPALLVTRAPRVAIIATGDEFAKPGKARQNADAIPESVSFGIAAMTRQWGGEIVASFRGGDKLDMLQSLAEDALAMADLIIVTGGASVGERDFAKAMFTPHGLDLLFSKVAIKPGKPVWLGRTAEKLVLGLPGNPTSAMVTARLFLVPVLAALLSLRNPAALDWHWLPLAKPLKEMGDRETFARAFWGRKGLELIENQDSAAQHALVRADWLIRCPAKQPALPMGTMVEAVQF